MMVTALAYSYICILVRGQWNHHKQARRATAANAKCAAHHNATNARPVPLCTKTTAWPTARFYPFNENILRS